MIFSNKLNAFKEENYFDKAYALFTRLFRRSYEVIPNHTKYHEEDTIYCINIKRSYDVIIDAVSTEIYLPSARNITTNHRRIIEGDGSTDTALYKDLLRKHHKSLVPRHSDTKLNNRQVLLDHDFYTLAKDIKDKLYFGFAVTFRSPEHSFHLRAYPIVAIAGNTDRFYGSYNFRYHRDYEMFDRITDEYVFSLDVRRLPRLFKTGE